MAGHTVQETTTILAQHKQNLDSSRVFIYSNRNLNLNIPPPLFFSSILTFLFHNITFSYTISSDHHEAHDDDEISKLNILNVTPKRFK